MILVVETWLWRNVLRRNLVGQFFEWQCSEISQIVLQLLQSSRCRSLLYLLPALMIERQTYRSTMFWRGLAIKRRRKNESLVFLSVTLLFQDDTGGLEVQNVYGDFVKVPPMKGPNNTSAMLIQVGDLLERQTSNRLLSTVSILYLRHRQDWQCR